MRKIALDLGTKTCGFAITDSSAIIATSLETIRFDENNFNIVIEKIKEFLSKYEDTDSIIVGYPIRSNGAKSERTIMVEEFALSLKSIFNQNIFLVNEYGTTIKAEQTLKSAKISIKKRKEIKDTLSAVIILQEFLDYGGKRL
ncbi:Holliday junction resolvase RuvX [Mycoplasma zalophidermidis]|uniref:Putative pre-16S rRNA nuclease n=1 Tax=Mycoplasma zalophidermidis TaxID=398174 RepID=A0ABS6DSS4_9MOLU|nr:Holliday junction resolvase RuvX [Mycoplasma zalophidermidis]MBU4689864.1 Holliday junction resolvase RuvX [Mycoplasma zalophidermidis]MBU4693650.1 Holliday junction resolvase RuvX [Mycoplasma zalophidermidis]